MKATRMQIIQRLTQMRIKKLINEMDEKRLQIKENNANFWYKTRLVLAALLAILILGVGLANASTVIEVAQSQIGKGEIGGDNKGPEVKKYTRGQEVAWCAGFVSWCRLRAKRPGNYFLSAKSYWNNSASIHSKTPKPGYAIVFTRGSKQGHVGIVEWVRGETFGTIEGNVGPYPARVKRLTYNIHNVPHLLGFVKI